MEIVSIISGGIASICIGWIIYTATNNIMKIKEDVKEIRKSTTWVEGVLDGEYETEKSK